MNKIHFQFYIFSVPVTLKLCKTKKPPSWISSLQLSQDGICVPGKDHMPPTLSLKFPQPALILVSLMMALSCPFKVWISKKESKALLTA